MIPYLELRLDAAKKTSSSARAGKKLNCKIEQCGGRCLRAGEVCRLTPTKEQGKIWGRAKTAVKPVKVASSTSIPKVTKATPKKSKKMDFDKFTNTVKKLYFDERRRQELRGVVAVKTKDIRRQFLDENPTMSESDFDKNFNKLKSGKKLFAVTEMKDELIQWAE